MNDDWWKRGMVKLKWPSRTVLTNLYCKVFQKYVKLRRWAFLELETENATIFVLSLALAILLANFCCTNSIISTIMRRKSITSATVVPTASDHNENLSDNRHDSFGHIANAEEHVTTTHDVSMDRNATDEIIHKINADQGEIDAVEPAPTVANTRDSQQRPCPPKLGSLPVSQSLRMNVALTHRGSFKLVNNYNALATSFKQLQPFARRPDGTYPPTLCVLCASAKPTSVFFPCQHMCVCDSCIKSNDMSPDCSMHLEQCVCPVCSADIGLILPHTGTEEEAYWKWALNSNKSSLPSQFTKDFQNAGKKIADTSIQQAGSIPTRRSSDTNNSIKDTPMPKLRRSWSATPSKRMSAYEVEATRQHENCVIL